MKARVIVDTCVWVQHFKVGIEGFERVFESQNIVYMPSLVEAELSLWTLPNRKKTKKMLATLARPKNQSLAELPNFIEENELFNVGIGGIDAHLLQICVEQDTKLWTIDKKLAAHAQRLGVKYDNN